MTGLKKEFLDLLRSDEEFRLAVAGLLGLDSILYELKALREDFNKFSVDVNRRFEEINKRFEDMNKRFDEVNRRFEDMNKRFEEVNRRFEDMNKRFDEVNVHFKEANKRFSGIELGLGALTESFYSRSLFDDLREELESRGETIVYKARNARVDEEEIDMLVVTDRAVYVVEVKVKPRHGDVGGLLAKVDVVSRKYRDKDIVPILAGTLIGKEVEEYAEGKGIKVYRY